MSEEPQWTLRLTLKGPFGEHYEMAMPVDAFGVRERLVDMRPPSEFDGRTMEQVVKVIRAREFRKDILERECQKLGRALGQRMEDAEGWHDASRIEPNKRLLRGERP